MRTDCEGKDINNVDFIFDCEDRHGHVVRHSFGRGGFDAYEEFDTEIKCAKCKLPHKAAHKVRRKHAKKVPRRAKAAVTRKLRPSARAPMALSARARKRSKAVGKGAQVPRFDHRLLKGLGDLVSSAPARKPDSQAVAYGPGGCVSTWQDKKTSHCIMKTACSDTDISGFDFGLICIDKQGRPARHLFGKDSFDPEERFDTMILCDQCLGLDEPGQERADEAVAMSEFAEMKGVMTDMTSQMRFLSKSIDKLEEKVFTDNSTDSSQAVTPSVATLHRKRKHRNLPTKDTMKPARPPSRAKAHHKAAHVQRQSVTSKAAETKEEKAAKDKVAAEIARVAAESDDDDEDLVPDAQQDAASDPAGDAEVEPSDAASTEAEAAGGDDDTEDTQQEPLPQ